MIQICVFTNQRHWGKCCRDSVCNMRFCIYEISQYSFLFVPILSHKPRSQLHLSFPFSFAPCPQCFFPPLITSLRQLKQCKPRKGVQIYQYANRFNNRLLSSESFSKPAKSLKKSDPFLSLTRRLLLLSRSSIDHLIDYLFMLFRSVKCHWSFIVRWMVFLQLAASFHPSPIHRSISQSLKYSYKSFGQDSGQDVHPHTHSNLRLSCLISVPKRSISPERHLKETQTDWGPFICLSQILVHCKNEPQISS